MRKIESPPKWPDEKLFSEGFKLLTEEPYQTLISEINEKYLYWDKVKYKIKNKGKVSRKLWWTAIKLGRMIHAKHIKFGKYNFTFNLTDFIQKGLHEFDLNIGGQLGTKTIIPKGDKKRYLISSIMEEAIASSQIEGAVTTRRKAKEMLRKRNKPRNKSEQMIVNNYLTIRHIVDIQNEPLNVERLFEIHRLITSRTLTDPSTEGTYRNNNEVDVIDAIDGEIVHSPPDYIEIPDLMDELFSFFNDTNDDQFIHPIIKGCIIHFMIGFFHPFVDGNGRTARTLFYWYLLRSGYWLTEYLSISRLIVKSKAQYALSFIHSEIDDNDLTYFINYKLKTMNLAFESLREYIERKINEKKIFIHFQRIKGINERQATIIKWIYEDPDILITVKEVEIRLNVSNQTGRNDLLDLVEKNYLEMLDMNKKTKAFHKSLNFESLLKENSIELDK